MAYLNPRVAILVRWHPVTNTRPDRYSVSIRNFPTKYYCLSSRNVPCEYLQIPHWLAETRIRELGLKWRISGCGTLPNGDHCLTTENGDSCNTRPTEKPHGPCSTCRHFVHKTKQWGDCTVISAPMFLQGKQHKDNGANCPKYSARADHCLTTE